MNPSNKSGSPRCFQSQLCGGKGSYPHRSILVFCVLVALQNWLQNCQKVANAWCFLHLRDVSLIYPASFSISPLILHASVSRVNGLNLAAGGSEDAADGGGRGAASWPLAGISMQPLRANQVHDQSRNRISSVLLDHQHPAPCASLEQSIELLGLAESWSMQDIPSSASARII